MMNVVSKLRWVALSCYVVGVPVFVYKFAVTPLGTKPSTWLKISFALIVVALAISLYSGWKQLRTLRQPRLFILGNIMLASGLIGSFFPIGNLTFLPLWLVFFFGAIIGATLASATAFLQAQY